MFDVWLGFVVWDLFDLGCCVWLMVSFAVYWWWLIEDLADLMVWFSGVAYHVACACLLWGFLITLWLFVVIEHWFRICWICYCYCLLCIVAIYCGWIITLNFLNAGVFCLVCGVVFVAVWVVRRLGWV